MYTFLLSITIEESLKTRRFMESAESKLLSMNVLHHLLLFCCFIASRPVLLAYLPHPSYAPCQINSAAAARPLEARKHIFSVHLYLLPSPTWLHHKTWVKFLCNINLQQLQTTGEQRCSGEEKNVVKSAIHCCLLV